MKKHIFPAIIFLFSFQLFSFTEKDIQTFTFENGLVLHFLKDMSITTVSIELNINAGLTDQTKEESGLLPFYANLLGMEITPDCMKIRCKTTSGKFQDTLEELSSKFIFKNYSDSFLEQAVKKQNSILSSLSPSSLFINSAMDTEIFSQFPWKQESGINPKVLSSLPLSQLRTSIKELHQKFITPQNSVLYISGNISETEILSAAENYFGKNQIIFSDSHKTLRPQDFGTTSKNTLPLSDIKKYVLYDDELSNDIIQTVFQYTNFTADQTDFLASILNAPSSTLKNRLFIQQNLGIPGTDYINVSSAVQKNSARLIIQTICQKTKTNPAEQGELIIKALKTYGLFSMEESLSAIKNANWLFSQMSDSSEELMKNLAVFNQTGRNAGGNFFYKNRRMENMDIPLLQEMFSTANPYAFLLCSTETYRTNRKQFQKYGWIPLTSKDFPWYKQKKYKMEESKNETPDSFHTGSNNLQNYIDLNRSYFSSFTISNGIEVILKSNPNLSTSSVSLVIDGGELNFAETEPGMAEILTYSLACLLQNQLDKKHSLSIIEYDAEVKAVTGNEYSQLTINCSGKDLNECIKTLADTIIYTDITPALADGIIFDMKSRWKVKNLTPDYQLLCGAMKEIYNGKTEQKLFNCKQDRPGTMEFTRIEQNYTSFLDSTKLTLAVTGSIKNKNEIQETIEQSFNQFQPAKHKENQKKNTGKSIPVRQKTKMEVPPLPQKTIKVPIIHRFFTDISPQKAGPRPPVLIPTTDFSDPMIFLMEGPSEQNHDSPLFNALLYLVQKRLQKKLSSEQTVIAEPSGQNLPYAHLIITKIKSIREIESKYSQTVKEILSELENYMNRKIASVHDLKKNKLLLELEELWILNETETSEPQKEADLIQKSIRNGSPTLYLDNCQTILNATEEDYYIVAKYYFSEKKPLKIYSKDTKN